MNTWQLPVTAALNGRIYRLHTDYRDILEIIGYLDDTDRPEYLRWRIALALFYEDDVPPEDWGAAMDYLSEFITCGESDGKPSPKLLDWQQDGEMIAAEINKAAGMEIRGVSYLHWWTFVGYFHCIGEGRLSTVVSIRDKLRRGKRLEKWEMEYYRENKAKVNLRRRYSADELAERARINALLGE